MYEASGCAINGAAEHLGTYLLRLPKYILIFQK